MASLEANFDTLIAKMKQGRNFYDSNFEPVYYLVYRPDEVLQAKRQLPLLLTKLNHENWKPHVLSMSATIGELLKNAKPRKIWLVGDRRAPLEWTKANESLANYLSQGCLQTVIEGKLAELETRTDHPVLVVTDLEALHPYLRIGAVESALYGKFKVPTVFMYPGVRAGATKLKFLGFYPEDGNYRSVHVGG